MKCNDSCPIYARLFRHFEQHCQLKDDNGDCLYERLQSFHRERIKERDDYGPREKSQ
jgi:hypothetical protein